MATNITDTNTATFPWPGVAQPVLEGQLWHLEYLGYEGPAPTDYAQANALIERQIELTDWSDYAPMKQEENEDWGDGFTIGEHQEARRKFLHHAAVLRGVKEARCRMKEVGI